MHNHIIPKRFYNLIFLIIFDLDHAIMYSSSNKKRNTQWRGVIRSNGSTASLTMKQTFFFSFFFSLFRTYNQKKIFLFRFQYIIFQTKMDLFLTLKPFRKIYSADERETPPVWSVRIYLEAIRQKASGRRLL